MAKPNEADISRLSRYFAIEANNEFWTLSEQSTTDAEKQRMLVTAFSSLYHWTKVGTQENIQLANLAVARALALNETEISLTYARESFDFFDGTGADWIQAFTNAVMSHALQVNKQFEQAEEFYSKALKIQAELTEGDRKVFDATFCHIPNPLHTPDLLLRN